jgi:hypothetical protein
MPGEAFRTEKENPLRLWERIDENDKLARFDFILSRASSFSPRGRIAYDHITRDVAHFVSNPPRFKISEFHDPVR